MFSLPWTWLTPCRSCLRTRLRRMCSLHSVRSTFICQRSASLRSRVLFSSAAGFLKRHPLVITHTHTHTHIHMCECVCVFVLYIYTYMSCCIRYHAVWDTMPQGIRSTDSIVRHGPRSCSSSCASSHSCSTPRRACSSVWPTQMQTGWRSCGSRSIRWVHPCHVCTRTGLTPATSVPGLGSPPLPRLHRVRAFRLQASIRSDRMQSLLKPLAVRRFLQPKPPQHCSCVVVSSCRPSDRVLRCAASRPR